MAVGEGDLGFTWRVLASGDVVISRHGREIVTLRGRAASAFAAAAAAAHAAAPEAIQQRLARLTGNYRRGNERAASRHPRNRSK